MLKQPSLPITIRYWDWAIATYTVYIYMHQSYKIENIKHDFIPKMILFSFKAHHHNRTPQPTKLRNHFTWSFSIIFICHQKIYHSFNISKDKNDFIHKIVKVVSQKFPIWAVSPNWGFLSFGEGGGGQAALKVPNIVQGFGYLALGSRINLKQMSEMQI